MKGRKTTKSDSAAREFLTPAEAGAILGIGLSGVYSAISRGDLPAVRIGPKLLRVPRSAIDDLAAAAIDKEVAASRP